MTRLPGLFILLAFHLAAFGQSSNEWINYSQEYYKIPVAKDGIYKLSYADLHQAGFPVGEDPRNFQLIHRGVEQAIHVEGVDDGLFNETDYVLFYGRKNDGTLDEKLYTAAEHQPHRYYNLFCDTTSYFFTVSAAMGKRMSSFGKANVDGLTPEAFHLEEKILALSEQYNPGRTINHEIFTSTFDENESWSGQSVRAGGSKDYQVTGITNTFTSAAKPEIEVMLIGRSAFLHNAKIFAGASMRQISAVSFAGFGRTLIREPLEWNDIAADGKLNVRLSVAASTFDDQVSIAFIRVVFNQKTDASSANEKIFNTVPSLANEVYFEVLNPPAGATIYDITAPDAVVRIGASGSPALGAIIPQATSSRKLLLTNTHLTPPLIRRIKFRQIIPGEQNYVIITHPRLRKPFGAYSDPVEAYAAYRASAEGGSFDTLIVHSRDLYDQFNYGEVSPLAIYSFLKFISHPSPPDYLFLMGKGLEITDRFHRQAAGKTWPYQDLVPTGGYPGSDMIFSAGATGSAHEHSVPTGRLSAMSPMQVAVYLDKIRESEAAPNELWRKKILHLSGGVEDGEPELFRSILESYGDIAEGPYLGAKVTALAKKSRDLEIVNVSQEVNNGLALITFFGHSSPRGFDFDLGYVNESVLGYRNKGKYPVLFMNGCEAGAFFLRDTIFAESWVYARDKGASAFIAHNSYGTIGVLSEYARNFYEVAFGDSVFFGRGLGDIQKETAIRHIEESAESIVNLSQIQQMVLLGDPALRLLNTRKTDLGIDESQISIVPYIGSYVNALTDSFAIRMIINNSGMARGDTFRIEVQRVLQDNSTLIYDSLIQVPFFSDTVDFVIRRGTADVSGNNTFRITLDADNIINEVNESNNTASYIFSVPSNGTRNIFPAAFSIVHEQEVRFSFQTTDLFSDKRTFEIEIDTVNSFDSPYLRHAEVEGKVLAMYTADILNRDSLAYYWRTRLRDPLAGETDLWATGSFSYIEESPEGWAQLHFSQFVDDAKVGLVANEHSRTFEFQQSVTPLEITTYGASAGKAARDVSVKIKGEEYNLNVSNLLFKCRLNTMNFIAFDKHSASPYAGIYLKWHEQFGKPINACGREPVLINSFLWNEVSKGGVRDVIQYVNNVADGDSVLMFNIGNASLHLWAPEAKAKLGELGVSLAQINLIASGHPVVIMGKKGTPPGSAKLYRVETGNPAVAKLSVIESVSGGFDSGTLTSPLIGPASHWKEIVFTAESQNIQDEMDVDVFGVKMNGSREILFEKIPDTKDLSSVNASEYPYLQLKFTGGDNLLLTSPQLRKWIVHFTPVPEGILIPAHSREPASYNEGVSWSNPYRFINLSDKYFPDSLGVNVKIFNRERSKSETSVFRIKSPLPMDTTDFTAMLSTAGFSGVNDIQLFVNPREIPELHYDNNIIQLNNYLSIEKDQLAPLIDVTFDDRHLLNDDFVSANPLIGITLWDENPFLLKTDTSGISLFLAFPCESEPCPAGNIWLQRSDVKWSKATLDSPFRIEFSPVNLNQGTYHLRVEASDATGNNADPYTIRFRVANDKSFEIIHLHPNPFNDHTFFGFILSADNIPNSLELEVTDLTGKVVFGQTFNEGLYVGRNLFKWNGHDNAGNPLRQGIYLYKLIVNDSGAAAITTGKIVIHR